jgi:hypothetical protein
VGREFESLQARQRNQGFMGFHLEAFFAYVPKAFSAPFTKRKEVGFPLVKQLHGLLAVEMSVQHWQSRE